jgi:hypothetical protein
LGRSPSGRQQLEVALPGASSAQQRQAQQLDAVAGAALPSRGLGLREPPLERADSGALFGSTGARRQAAGPGAVLGAGLRQPMQPFLAAAMYGSNEEGRVLQPEDSGVGALAGAGGSAPAAAAAAQPAAAPEELQDGEAQPSLVQQLVAGQQLLSMLRESQEILQDMQRKASAQAARLHAAGSPLRPVAAPPGAWSCLHQAYMVPGARPSAPAAPRHVQSDQRPPAPCRQTRLQDATLQRQQSTLLRCRLF